MNIDSLSIKKVVTGRGLLFNERGNLLVVSEKDGRWHLPGGWSDKGELIELTCAREIQEETGISVNISKVVFIEEAIVPDEMNSDGLLHRLDIFCICSSDNCTIDKSFIDVDNGLIQNRKFISESEWQEGDVLGPKQLKEMSFDRIQALPNCYNKRLCLDPKYKHLLGIL